MIQWLRQKLHINEPEIRLEQTGRKTNPWLSQIRPILEQILLQRGMNYGDMRLVIIDTDTEQESFLEEDEVMETLGRLSPDLNFLTIVTARPEYFREYVETMYEENGLPVLIEEKETAGNLMANAVLDFEQTGEMWNIKLPETSFYCPIYKKDWEVVKKGMEVAKEVAEDLDISVPIGYNVVIVKGICGAEKRGRVL